MNVGRLLGCATAVPSCLIASGALWVCQRAGWQSDGPGLICPMGVGLVAGVVGLAALWGALTAPPSEPPKL
ncbi:MAG: hypothetical protein ACOZQL_35980 [Myxococcota bacterium]